MKKPGKKIRIPLDIVQKSGIIYCVDADGDEGTPVPIPNTEVKLISVEDTWLDTARENREMPTFRLIQSDGLFCCPDFGERRNRRGENSSKESKTGFPHSKR